MNRFSKTVTTSSAIYGSIVVNSSNFNIVKDMIIPIIASIIAAIIFWIAFNYIPEKKRATKIRPKLEYNMLNIYNNLVYYFDTILKPNLHSPSFLQGKIKGGILEKEDIILGR